MAGIFIDLQKAFDSVNHSNLIHKLEKYGIRGPILSLFNSYLTDRYQYVSINGYNSSHKKIIRRVPQGSILGPIFFIVYVNVMYKSIKNSKIFSYAEDTTIQKTKLLTLWKSI